MLMAPNSPRKVCICRRRLPNFSQAASHDRAAYLSFLHIAHGVASGLAHTHANNICHADLKPANILLSEALPPMALQPGGLRGWRPTPKLADFGLACRSDPASGAADLAEGVCR